MIDIEMTISYFNAESCDSVEFTATIPTQLRTIDAAKLEARKLVDEAMKDAYDDGAMMDTFYYEFDFLVPQNLIAAE